MTERAVPKNNIFSLPHPAGGGMPPGKFWKKVLPWVLPTLLLSLVYGVLYLTNTAQPDHTSLMQRCVLMNPTLARIWSVGNMEIGIAYLFIFGSMVFYLLRAAKTDPTHLRDLAIGIVYISVSFILDSICVRYLKPFQALLVGDVVVMTFTLIVSRQLWFQRLLGIFVPFVFLSCGIGHLLEGLSYWNTTYPFNVPWTMVTGDIGFAVLVNSVRFPAFIRGSDIMEELEVVRREARLKHNFLRDVLRTATDDRLYFCQTAEDLPMPPSQIGEPIFLNSEEMVSTARKWATQTIRQMGFSEDDALRISTIIGEAASNALKHGRDGVVSLYGDDHSIQVWVADKGNGIPLDILPRAILERGFSTTKTLGQGFALMLDMSDRMDLLTTGQGTTLVFTLYRNRVHDDRVEIPNLVYML